MAIDLYYQSLDKENSNLILDKIYYHLGICYFAKKEFESAADCFEHPSIDSIINDEIIYKTVYCYWKLKYSDELEEYIHHLEEIEYKNKEIIDNAEIVLNFMKTKDYIDILSKLKPKMNSNDNLRNLLKHVYGERLYLEQEKKICEENKNLKRLAECYYMLGEHQKCVTTLEQFFQKTNGDANSYLVVAKCHERLRNNKQAEEYYKLALQLAKGQKPTKYKPFVDYALFLRKTKRAEKGIELLEEALKNENFENNVQLYLQLGNLCYFKEDYSQAKERYTQFSIFLGVLLNRIEKKIKKCEQKIKEEEEKNPKLLQKKAEFQKRKTNIKEEIIKNDLSMITDFPKYSPYFSKDVEEGANQEIFDTFDVVTQFQHENIIKYEEYKNNKLKMERCNGGNLFDFIHKKNQMNKISLEQKMSIIEQIVKAVQYLNKMKFRIKRLNPYYILFQEKVNPGAIPKVKLTHYISISSDKYKYSNWVHPDVFNNESSYYILYSLGIIIWELFTRKVPFQDILDCTKEDKDTIYNIINTHLNMVFPEDTPIEIVKLLILLLDKKEVKLHPEDSILEKILQIQWKDEEQFQLKSKLSFDIFDDILLKRNNSNLDDTIFIEEISYLIEKGAKLPNNLNLLRYDAYHENGKVVYAHNPGINSNLHSLIKNKKIKGHLIHKIISKIVSGISEILENGFFISSIVPFYIFIGLPKDENDIDNIIVKIANYGREENDFLKFFNIGKFPSEGIIGDFFNLFAKLMLESKGIVEEPNFDIIENLEKKINFCNPKEKEIFEILKAAQKEDEDVKKTFTEISSILKNEESISDSITGEI